MVMHPDGQLSQLTMTAATDDAAPNEAAERKVAVHTVVASGDGSAAFQVRVTHDEGAHVACHIQVCDAAGLGEREREMRLTIPRPSSQHWALLIVPGSAGVRARRCTSG